MKNAPNKNISLDNGYMPQIGPKQKRARPQTAGNRMPTSPSGYFDKAGPRKIPAVLPTAKDMGKNCEREQLYAETMQLKRTVNSLRKELAETKSQVVKTELTLRKKEKIIEDLSKENDVEEIKKDNIKRAKDSTIVTLVKKKYKELQQGYKELQEENDNLKANTKLTKIKEIQIQTEILQEEMTKMKNLYRESCNQNRSNIEQLSELNEIKNKFAQQHLIIQNLQELCDNSSKENKELKNQIDLIKEKSLKKDEVIKKQKIDNKKLKVTNDNYLNEKKMKEPFAMGYNEYIQKLRDLEEKNKILKQEYKSKETECIDQKKLIEEMRKKIATPINPICKTYNVKEQKHIESKPVSDNTTKVELLSSLVKELKIKCNIYEKYLMSNGIEPESVLKEYNYTGVVPPKSATLKGTQRTGEMNIQNSQQEGLSESKRFDENEAATNTFKKTQFCLENQ